MAQVNINSPELKNCPLCLQYKSLQIERLNINLLKKMYFNRFKYEIKKDIDYIGVNECKNCGLIYFDPTIVGDSNFYLSLHKKMDEYYPDEKIEFNIAASHIHDGYKVLEIGAGVGMFYNKIKDRCTDYLGIEISVEAVEKAKKKNINIQLTNLENVSKEHKGYYDLVVSFQVMEHIQIDQLHDTFVTSLECINENGFLIMSVPSNDSYLRFLSNATLNLPPHHQTRWSDKTFKKMEKNFNCKLIKIYHEKLKEDNYHEWFRAYSKNKLSNKNKYIDNRYLFNKGIAYFDKTLNYNNILLNRMINEKNPIGQTVTVVFQKIKSND